MLKLRGRSRWTTALMACVVVVGALGIWLFAAHVDHEMREDRLARARLVGQAVSIESIRALTGTETDLGTENYLRLKTKLARIADTDDKCRFIYLMGRKADGRAIFYVDSEPVGSDEECPAGQVYEEVPTDYLRVFDERIALTVGPVTDRLGTWIASLVPLEDPRTGELIAVLGMHVDAGSWKVDILGDMVLPASLVLTLLIILAVRLPVSQTRTMATLRPVQRRMLIPLSAVLLLMVAVFGWVLTSQYHSNMRQHISTVLSTAVMDLDRSLEEQCEMLAALEKAILGDEGLRNALRAHDRDRLLADWEPLYEQLRQAHGITHFYFHGPDRINMLRVHKPDRYGDLINRHTALEAEYTGKTAAGIELGPLGTFTLRVVHPVFGGETLLGYLELGKEIEDVLSDIHEANRVELAVAIHKSALERTEWESGMRMLGKEADWDRYGDKVLVHSTLSPFPVVCDPFVHEDGHQHGDWSAEVELGSRTWRVLVSSLRDVSGSEVGDLIVMRDVSSAAASFRRLIAVVLSLCLVVLVGMIASLHIVLRHTDAGIRAQQETLRTERERLAATLHSIGDAVVSTDAAGRVVDMNAVAETLMGLSVAKARGRPIREVFRLVSRLTRDSISNPVDYVPTDGDAVDLNDDSILLALDGTEREIAHLASRIRDDAGSVMGTVLVFRDVSETSAMQRELREHRERFERLAEESGTFMWEVDAEGVYTHVGLVVEQLLGYRPEDLIGKKHIYDLQPEEGRETFKQNVLRSFDQKTILAGMENALQAQDGRIVWVLTDGVPVLSASGELLGYRGMDRDITRQRAAAEAESKALAEMQRLNRLMSGREDRVLELKAEVNALQAELGREAKYGRGV